MKVWNGCPRLTPGTSVDSAYRYHCTRPSVKPTVPRQRWPRALIPHVRPLPIIGLRHIDASTGVMSVCCRPFRIPNFHIDHPSGGRSCNPKFRQIQLMQH